jgi:DHA1 family bicyclomycin/chloramphenicol resistance-like MFS transporter
MGTQKKAPNPVAVLFNLLGQIAFGMLLMSLCLPSMQEWGAIFGVEQAGVQLTFGAYVVAFGFTQLLYGPWSDVYGRQRVLMAGLVLAGIGSLWAALADGLSSLILARALQGAGASAGMVIGRAMVQDLYQGADRTRIMAYVGMAMGMSPPLGTLIGGQLHEHVGWQANFWLATLLSLLLLIAAWRGLPDVATRRENSGTHWLSAMASSYVRLVHEPAFLLYVAILSFTYATLYAFFSGVPAVLASYGVGPAQVGWFIACMTVSYIAGSFLASRLVQKLGERLIMALGQAGTVFGVALMLGLAVMDVDQRWAFALPLLFVGAGHGLMVPSTLTGIVGVVPAVAGAAAAVAGLMQQLIGAWGGYSVGLLPRQDVAHLAGLMLVYTVLAAIAQAWLHLGLVSRKVKPIP